jgi:hypothetical protein
MDEQTSAGSGTNTVLIVILLLVVVAGGVWIAARGGFGSRNADNGTKDINVDLSLPGGQQGESGGYGGGGQEGQ